MAADVAVSRPADPPFPYPWEEIGPGYHARALGQWDIAHAVIDVLPTLRKHAEWQIKNNLANQRPDGLVPGVIWMKGAGPTFSKKAGHTPFWPIAVSDFASQDLLRSCFKQIAWFEQLRAAQPAGFWHARQTWESGIDDDPRQPFSEASNPRLAAIDATSTVYSMYAAASSRAKALGMEAFADKAGKLPSYIREELYDRESGFFSDAWSVRDREKRIESFAAMWPIVFGIATVEQANRFIDQHLLNPKRLCSPRRPIWPFVPGTRGFERMPRRGYSNPPLKRSEKGNECLAIGRRQLKAKFVTADDSAWIQPIFERRDRAVMFQRSPVPDTLQRRHLVVTGSFPRLQGVAGVGSDAR